jgi:LmbE family N-acetylglucosaminyl deacetylase
VNIEFNSQQDFGVMGNIGNVANLTATRKNGVRMVFAPHQDDETLLFAHSITAARRSNWTVKIVFSTHSSGGLALPGRMTEALDVLTLPINHINIPRRDIMFLGYGDGNTLEQTFLSNSPATPIPAGWEVRNFEPQGIFSFHALRRGGRSAPPRSFTRNNTINDFVDIIDLYRPTEIFTTSEHEGTANTDELHRDHRATYGFVNEALIILKRSLVTYSPRLNFSLVWGATSEYPGNNDERFLNPFAQNGNQEISTKPLIWENRVRFSLVPNSITISQKQTALLAYKSQITSKSSPLYRFAKEEEYCWTKDFANIAYIATVRCSSENSSAGRVARNVINGIISGETDTQLSSNINGRQEWEVSSGTTGWVELDFGRLFTVRRICLYNRRNNIDNILESTLSFSHGTAVDVDLLPATGIRREIILNPPREVRTIRFTIQRCFSNARRAGLAEIEVFA